MRFRRRPQLTGGSETARTICQNATEQAFNPREEIMTHGLKPCLLSVALLCALGSVAYPQNPPRALPPGAQNNPAQPTPAATPRTVQGFVPLTDQTLRNPKPEDWLMLRGNYQGWGYSTLDQINKTNVKNLQLVWARVMEPGINEATPIVYNGVMYLGNSNDVVQAIDATNGDLLWEYRHPLPEASAFHGMLGQRKRSVAVYGDNVYFVTWDNFVVALEARTGKLAWQTNRGGDLFVSNSTGPIVVNGMVIAGSTCQYAGFGCYVTAHDMKTGEELWRNTFIPRPGQPHDVDQPRCPPRTPQDTDRRALQDRNRVELRCCQRRIPVGEVDCRAESRRQDRPQRVRHRQRKRGAQGGRQDLPHVPDLHGRPRLAERGLQSEDQRHVHAAAASLLRHYRPGRSRCRAAVRLQHKQRGEARIRQGQGRPRRCDLGRDRQDAVELRDAGSELLACFGHWRRASVQRRDGPLPA